MNLSPLGCHLRYGPVYPRPGFGRGAGPAIPGRHLLYERLGLNQELREGGREREGPAQAEYTYQETMLIGLFETQ